VLTFK